MKVSELVAEWLSTVNTRVYALCGAGAMHLNDAICHHPKLQVIACHHEQAATFAAEADARVSGKPGIVHVTAGPGASNTITGLACAYVDSIPLICIAGQVTTNTLKRDGMRQLGMNEMDMVSIAQPVTKYAVSVNEPEAILWELGYALMIATSGRKGPVFIEIPLDVQSADVDPEKLTKFNRLSEVPLFSPNDVSGILRSVAEAERPVLIIGNGVRLAGAVEECRRFATELNIPVISSWSASDIVPTDHPCYIGRSGIFGCRPANMTVQNADLILAIGTRLSIPQTGHAQHLFAPNAKKIVIDIDRIEAEKLASACWAVSADARMFLRLALAEILCFAPSIRHATWLARCRSWRDTYPVMLDDYRSETDGVNAYHFVEELAKHLPDDAIVVTDVGAAFIATMQSMPVKKGQRLFHSGGVSPMGWGLPAAIGACVAGGGRKVVCLTGDGGLMLNLQELQTIAHHKLPISIFVFSNNGYMTIQHMQDNHFKRESISSLESGMSLPNFVDVARSFDVEAVKIRKWDSTSLVENTEYACISDKPLLVEVKLPSDQKLLPRVQTKVENGKFIPTPIDDMFPYLDREGEGGVTLEKERAA
jgi:acetolactate synthase-1/2/3 large subunit